MENTLELGKTYNFAGYRWVPVHINEENQIAVMQSLGVTSGSWAGYAMPQFGNEYYYTQDISGMDISDYDENTRTLMGQIKPVISGNTGLYLPSYNDIEINAVWKKALARAATNYSTFGATDYSTWIGTFYGNDGAWCVNSNGNVYNDDQNDSYVVAPGFNLDLSKIEVEGDEIKAKVSSASESGFINPAQSLINKLYKQADDLPKLLKLAAGALDGYAADAAYMHKRFFDGLPVHRLGDDESDGIECPTCKYEVARNDDFPDERPCHCPNCGTKLIY